LSHSSRVIFAPCDNVENNSNNNHESEDQCVLSQQSQVIFVPCDNVNSDHESDIQVPKEVCSHRDQNLNENHETTQSIRTSIRTKIPPEYLKDYHCSLNVSILNIF